ncbi:MAG: VWA domain-containing protein [Planctomycetia bacterium]|nr:VWA domain-containing protein [Planctomycetia bacterium]
MIAELRKLRTFAWPKRISVRLFWDRLQSWNERIVNLCLDTDPGRALSFSLLLHVVVGAWAAVSYFHVELEPRLATTMNATFDSDSQQSGLPIEFSTLAPATESHADGGSSGATPLLSMLAPNPDIVDPLADEGLNAVNLHTEISSNLGAAVGVANNNARSANIHGLRKQTGNGNGVGKGIGNGIGDGKQFFGMASEGKSFVYVLDCSMSMNHPHDSEAKTRFKRIKLELLNSIHHLRPDQEFFIVFFNHEAIAMPANGMVSAVAENQARYLNWMKEVTAVGDTDPTAALEIALKLRPDVIYFLTDGAFSPDANQIVRSIKQSRSIIHTFTFEQNLTKKQQAGIELMRQKKHSTAMLKLGENTYRQTREIFIADQVMHDIAAHNGGQFHVIP